MAAKNFVRLTFDEDPTLDVEGVSDAAENVKEKSMQKALVKPMMVEDEAGRPTSSSRYCSRTPQTKM